MLGGPTRSIYRAMPLQSKVRGFRCQNLTSLPTDLYAFTLARSLLDTIQVQGFEDQSLVYARFIHLQGLAVVIAFKLYRLTTSRIQPDTLLRTRGSDIHHSGCRFPSSFPFQVNEQAYKCLPTTRALRAPRLIRLAHRKTDAGNIGIADLSLLI